MRKIKYEIEATDEGYVERLIIDDVIMCTHEAKRDEYAGGFKGDKNSLDDYCYTRDDLEGIADELPAFLGLTLSNHIEAWYD